MTIAPDLDPRTKLVLMACLSSTAVIITHWAFLSGLLTVSLLLLLYLGINPVNMINKTRKLFYMVVIIALMQSIFTADGLALVTVGNLKLFTTNGLIMALEFILRMAVIIASACILTTSNSREIVQGLIQLRLPYEIAFMASVGIQFLPIMAEEFKNAMIAVQLRGVDLKNLSWRHKTELVVSLLQPVAAGAIIKSRAIAMSIEMRGFRAYPTRSSYLILKYQTRDYLVITCSLLLTAITLLAYFTFR